MLKNIQLRLQQIKYSGASVGRDVRIEIDARKGDLASVGILEIVD